MKAGDYVRLPDGIHKIKEYEYRPEYENCHCMYLDDNDYGLLFTDKELIKSSPNIIDLIEYGDIVKYKIDDEEFIMEVWGEKNDYFVQNFDVRIDLRDLNIVSIVTKEQFESMEYKVKE